MEAVSFLNRESEGMSEPQTVAPYAIADAASPVAPMLAVGHCYFNILDTVLFFPSNLHSLKARPPLKLQTS